MSKEEKNLFDQLNEVLGYEVGKGPNPGAEIYAEIQQEMLEKRQEEAKEKARKLMVEVHDLGTEFSKWESDCEKQRQKFKKGLGKLISQYQQACGGKPVVDDEDTQVTKAPTQEA